MTTVPYRGKTVYMYMSTDITTDMTNGIKFKYINYTKRYQTLRNKDHNNDLFHFRLFIVGLPAQQKYRSFVS